MLGAMRGIWRGLPVSGLSVRELFRKGRAPERGAYPEIIFRRLTKVKDDKVPCPECGKDFYRDYMRVTKDCRGIPFRRVCLDCYDKIMVGRGFDGAYYTEEDECIDEDY